MANFTLGIDLGKSQDYSAVAMVERVQMQQPTYPDVGREEVKVWDVYHVGALWRWPLGTPYYQIVRDVAEILRDSGHPEAHVAIDAGGVGEAIARLFLEAFLEDKLGLRRPSPYKITAGSGEDLFRKGFCLVGKIELVADIQRPQQAGLLRIAAGLEYAPVIKAEFKSFTAKVTASGHETLAARTGAHDDLLQALSLAMHHSLHYHRVPCRRIPYKEPVLAPLVPGPAPKVFGIDPDMGPAEEPSDDEEPDEVDETEEIAAD